MKYTKADIIKVLTTAGIEREKAQTVTRLIVQSITAALAAGNVIELRGMGTLEPRERKPRTMRNPRTGKPVNVPARHIVFFKPGHELKKILNEGGSPM